jgi:site-specific DNA-methyltransferase (adenine-specific)
MTPLPWTLRTGDCHEVLPTLPADTFDAVVTDPPYELTSAHGPREPQYGNGQGAQRERANRGKGGGFMSMRWDASGVAFDPATWAAVLRVAKPGAYLLAAGSPRTYHRLACAIEDGGWVIRDCIRHETVEEVPASIGWYYGSGFPKSLSL